ncbi:helix-turn-helix domain-containing protein [Amycolatopsis sp. NPDC051903]|uniref:helix-turn-helix domain-containing protein n=1 Tax=Amycolatopsis sp. NPDC051903 TaxID=3363936 RepID=UPI0037AB2B33
MTPHQVELLRWLADGCPERDWPDHTHKTTIRALHSRGLAKITRKRKIWAATITERGRYYLSHGRYPPAIASHATATDPPEVPLTRDQRRTDEPVLDTTARAMQRLNRRPQTPAKRTTRTVQETYMRYKVVVTRVQVAERFVRASSEEDAASKTQEEFDRPYGYFGSWKTTGTEVDVIEAEQTIVIKPTSLAAYGPLLLSLKDAGKALGLSYSTLYQMVNQGDIDHVLLGTRKYISRAHLIEFIERNTHKGYYRAR